MWRLSTDVMLVARFDATIVAVNPAWTALFGWSGDELVERSFMDLIHPDDVGSTVSAVSDLAAGSVIPRFENRYRAKDGTYRWVSWTAVPDESFIHAVGRDVQSEKEAAEALARTEEALRQSQKMEAVGQLTGGLAHDFNNLLTGISGSLELLQTRMSQGRLTDLDRYINAAQGASKRAAALTHRLLAFSRRQTLDPKPTDVNALVHGMEELIRRTVGPAIHIEVVGAAGLWPALVDPPQLENALLNLCINARDAMPDGGRITIETANKWLDERAAKERDLPPGQYLSLCVTDTGTGMTPDVIARAFDPFFTTKPTGQGTGLGLSMIYGFARQSGGQVRIYSEVGEGTTMCFYLPRYYGEAEGTETMPDLAGAPRAEQGETVLIVDDEPTVRMLVTEVLEDLGYTAIEATDGPSGLKVLQSDVRIDLLVTDVGLPGGMNGRQMADAARVSRPELKILFITGYAENAAVGNGHLEPGMQVLTKPFVMEVLATRIKDLITTP
jgi:PAS domain S-box-containing protein